MILPVGKDTPALNVNWEAIGVSGSGSFGYGDREGRENQGIDADVNS